MNGAPGFMQHQNGMVAGEMRQEKVGKHNELGLIYLASCNREKLMKLWERSGAWVRISAQPQHSEE
jgi:hypothetical protein